MTEILAHRASSAQRRLWFVEQLVAGEPVHNIASEGRYADALDASVLRAAVADVVARHESLRTKFEVRDGELCQIVLDPPDEPPVRLVDLTGAPDPDRAYEVLCHEVAVEPFDLAAAPLLRLVHVRLGDRADAMILVFHHLVGDATSAGILMRELTAAYEARSAGVAPDWPELDVQYVDFTAWQEEQAEQPADLAYWREQLADLSTLDLSRGSRRPERVSQRGRRLELTLGSDLAARLRDFARAERATPFMVLLAAYAAALGRVFGAEDVAVGGTVAGRPLPQVQDVVGAFVDRVVLRMDLSAGPGLGELVGQARRVVTEAYDHLGVTFDQVVDALAPEREAGVTPLAQAGINLHPPAVARRGGSVMPRTISGGVIHTGTVAQDLLLDVAEDADGYTVFLSYRTDIVDDEAAEQVRDLFLSVLRAGLADRSRPLWTIPASAVVSVVPASSEGPQLLHEVIGQWAARTPNAVALVGPSKALTFAEFDAAANRLAHALRARGVGPESPVLVAVPRSVELFVAMLGVLKAGGVYVPVDPSSTVVNRCGAKVAVVADSQVNLPGVEVLTVDTGAGADPGAPNVLVQPANAAYLLFTSGSTGQPKGVVVEHRNVVSYLRALVPLFPPGASHLSVQPPTFDSSMTSTLGALANGGTLYVADDDLARDPRALSAFMSAHPVDYVKITPSHLAALLDHGLTRPERAVILGGETAGPALTARLRADGWGVIIHYGPTETAIGVCAQPLTAPSPAPLGKPLPGNGVYLLDRWLQPVPRGCRGEVYVGGAQVSRGYLGSPAATASAFLPDPFAGQSGARMYRTGDLARERPDGSLEFCGRADRQLKIRGFRIEPGEVEAALQTHPAVSRCVVVGRDGQLVAYVTPVEMDSALLKDFAAGVLPPHAVPAEIIPLVDIPVTRHGKVDFAALPVPSDPVVAGDEPVSWAERTLHDCWRQVLPDRVFGVTERFFDVGGDSIRAIRVVAEARRRGLPVTLPKFFKHLTIRAIAQTLDVRRPAAPLGLTGPTVLRFPTVVRREDVPDHPGITVDGCLVSFDPTEVDDRSIELVARRLCPPGPAVDAPGAVIAQSTMAALAGEAHEAYNTTTAELVVAATMAALSVTAVAVADTRPSTVDEIGLHAKPGSVVVEPWRTEAELVRGVKAALRSPGADRSELPGVRVIALPGSVAATEVGAADRVIVTVAGARVLAADPGLAERVVDQLSALVDHCLTVEPEYTAADFPDAGLDDAAMARVFAGLDEDMP
ncbi:amino acid adenylation domain-containing protein [Kutzneria sp. NPDC052558]|uniref:amino acid adenylation domain-containing protein n=1 Tax=Kutzneria sp. NPDC052558 TaxID=3364121 RepID=UPI0037C9EAA8